MPVRCPCLAVTLAALAAPAPPDDRCSTDTLAGFDNGPVVDGAYFLSARHGTGHFVDASIGVG